MKTVQKIILLIAIIIPIFFYFQEFFIIDSCLNKGGSYDYKNMICDYQQNHQFIPFFERTYLFRDLGIWFIICSLIFFSTFKTKTIKLTIFMIATVLCMKYMIFILEDGWKDIKYNKSGYLYWVTSPVAGEFMHD